MKQQRGAQSQCGVLNQAGNSCDVCCRCWREEQRADWVWRASGWHGNGSVRHGDADGRGPVAGVTALSVFVSACAALMVLRSIALLKL